ncbi:alanine racemase [bacterium BMS3Abin01]|nr:alanine racemase [bacterium BMS3Abin01]HDY69880.1 alanine racemase [Actinomycetota bacterium]
MARALATVDLECVRSNVTALKQRLSPDCSLMAVVKAGGYGHGAVPVARACLEAGATALGVATVSEAQELRRAGLEDSILIMGPLTGEEAASAMEADADVVIWSLPFLKELIRIGYGAGRRARVHVKVDTGMRRLGLFPRGLPEMLDAIEMAPEVELTGLMSHFATADEDDEDFFRFQLRTFEEAVQVVLRTGAGAVFHCANSAATIRYPESHFNMVRCGIAVYGLSPTQGDASADGLRPALRLTSYVAGIKRLIEGDLVGYGCTWRAPADTDIALVPIGYGDGVSRRLSNRGEVLIGGRRRPIAGRVSMDLVTVDLGKDAGVRPGDEVALIGRQEEQEISAEELAGLLDTINYEVTCNLSPRVQRRYVR